MKMENNFLKWDAMLNACYIVESTNRRYVKTHTHTHTAEIYKATLTS